MIRHNKIDPDIEPYSCMAWRKLTERYDPKINFNEFFSMESDIAIPTKCKKNKALLIL